MLELTNVAKMYSNINGEKIEAVGGLSLNIEENEMVCLVGRSGCGKTTTLRLIAGLESPSQGRISLRGKKVEGPAAERCVVFQRYTLFPWRSVLANVAFGLEMQGVSKKEREAAALKYLGLVGLEDQAKAYPPELSGGMQQRVAVARALAADPEVLLMDEPFGALDAQTRNVLQQELMRIWRADQKTIVFVTHDIQEAVLLADRVVVMQGPPGRIREIMDCNLPRPRDRNSAEFIGMCDRIHALLEGAD
ncbi:NitT/TauT family transport system ATP-binding protein [Desulfatibacillum alkenivorans DSM 16219]|jgi:NitT/TauT family transport system ATP-binding protein|uniref:NitT/TauT family transport system ATP-binding protein n=1 Tax=Desulfatibacillum alkenivorans DSM 16219 TaxID=1121393 RepID=A0A1M6LSC7_9BACT|nr:ABC transporter ATP-binding protein [Desulfatibacillum alkenivorans]SHJ74035.1 NitT/TauT family transport system ATP-binding protein [Desulfatibacillum alkenivorans DSM 16219]